MEEPTIHAQPQLRQICAAGLVSSGNADGKYMGLFSDLSPGSTQNYSGLITSIKTRPTKNTNVNVNYTWSHCIGDPVNGFTSAGGAKADQTFSKAFDRRYDHGNCVFDRRQIFNLTTVLATPHSPTIRCA
jgi:hypothetical protein